MAPPRNKQETVPDLAPLVLALPVDGGADSQKRRRKEEKDEGENTADTTLSCLLCA
jgi:hypothetical protein